ncbi:MAG TPA: hypothetical protein VFC75_04560 [Erysipelothrix sp.]|nr:hypothetical protein [Erysipelothrix sp.]
MTDTEEKEVKVSDEANNYQMIVDEIINSYFHITKTKLTPDDPTVGMLLAQRINLDKETTQLSKDIDKKVTKQINRLDAHLTKISTNIDTHVEQHYERLKTIFDEVESQTVGRLTEIDKRYQDAGTLATELKHQRQSLLTELDNRHHKSIITFGKDVNDKLDEAIKSNDNLLRNLKYTLFTAVGLSVSSVLTLILLISLIMK